MTQRNRVIIVTGASSGIGRLVALELGRQRARVVLAARSAAELDAVVAEITAAGGEALGVPTDVTRQADVDALIGGALERFGRIDALVNNAGYGVFAPLERAEIGDIEGMMEVNYFGTIRCTRAVLPVMRKQGSGHIINVASVAGLVSTPNMAAYSASKHAVVAATQALQVELHGSPIKCSMICPGPVDTPFFQKADYNQMSRLAKIFGMLKPAEVARLIVQMIEHPRTMRVIPRGFHILAIAYRLFPFLTKRVLRWVG